MAYLNTLETYMWAFQDGSMRYVIKTDPANRIAHPMQPTPNVAGRKSHVLHQSRLKHLLHDAFSTFKPDIIADHPITETINPATGWTTAFSSNLLCVLRHNIIPRTSNSNAAAVHLVHLV